MHHAELSSLWITTTNTEPRSALTQVLDTHPTLFFHLKQQLVIELLRAGNTDEAFDTASNELAPLAEEHPPLCTELEHVMVLFMLDGAFTGDASVPASIIELASIARRDTVADELNVAMLEAQGRNPTPKLAELLRHLQYGEQLLSQTVDVQVLDTDTPLKYLSERT